METAHYYESWGRVPRLPWSLQNKLQMKNFKQKNDKVSFFEMAGSHVFQASNVIHTQGWFWIFNPPDFLNGWVTSLPHHRKSDTVLGTKPWTSCMLHRHSGNWAIPSVPNPVCLRCGMLNAAHIRCSLNIWDSVIGTVMGRSE